MKMYCWSIDKHHYRDGRYLHTVAGVVFANDADDARDKVWAAHGNDNSCNLVIWEVLLNEYKDNVIPIMMGEERGRFYEP